MSYEDPTEFTLDTEMPGLQYQLIERLAAHDIMWFVDFSQVESDMGNRELKVILISDYTPEMKKVTEDFAKENGFQSCFYVKDRGTIYMRRT